MTTPALVSHQLVARHCEVWSRARDVTAGEGRTGRVSSHALRRIRSGLGLSSLGERERRSATGVELLGGA